MWAVLYGALGFSLAAFLPVTVVSLDPDVRNPTFTFDTISIKNAVGKKRMELRFSPCSDHWFTIDKAGLFNAFSEVADEKAFTFSIKDDVYDNGDHGPTGMVVHPKFPATPSIFVFYTADPTHQWTDPVTGVDSCPKPPDPFGFRYCDSKQRLERFDLQVTMTGTRCTAFSLAKRQILIEDWCSASLSHGNGNIEWYNGSDMILTSGDGAQPSQVDYGQRVGDVCYDKTDVLPQGRFRAQRLDYLQGKLLLIKSASLLKNVGLVEKTDFNIVARGLRQPYVNAVNPWTGDVLIGDVGSKIWEEVNVVTKAEMTTPSLWPLNFGWPCIEGDRDFADPTDLDFAWLKQTCDKTKGQLCDICAAVWPCASPTGIKTPGCSASYRNPSFKYRSTIDRDNSNLCKFETSAIVGLTFIQGSDFGNTDLPYALVGNDYATGCMFYWDMDPVTKRVKFEDGASVFATGFEAGLYLTRGKNGYLYSSKGDPVADLYTIYRFGLLPSGGIANPTAVLKTFLQDAGKTTFTAIDCTAGCQVPAGSTIKFDGSGSKVAANGGVITTYQFNYGDGSFSGKVTTPTVTKTYATGGSFGAMLTVTDSGGRTGKATANIQVRSTIVSLTLTPASGVWVLGDTLTYTLSGLTAADVKSVTFDGTISHCRNNPCTGGVDCHTHSNGVDAGGTLFSGKLTPPEHAMPSSIVLTATIVPKVGSAFSVSTTTKARVFNPTIQAAALVPGAAAVVQTGWPVNIVDDTTCFSPCKNPYMARGATDLSSQTIMYRADKIYTFAQWEINKFGKITTQDNPGVVVVGNNIVVTAQYSQITTGITTDTTSPGPVLVGLAGYYGFIEVKWTVPTGSSYDWVLIYVRAADGTDRSTSTLATDRKAVVGGLGVTATTWTVKLTGYNAATKKKSTLGKLLTVSSSGDSTKTCYAQSSPYGNTAPNLPGTIEFERFDEGGEGAAYHDLTSGNTGGAAFRTNLDVDIQGTAAGGYSVTQTLGTEWLQYTVNVLTAGDYNFTFYLAAVTATLGRKIFVMADAMGCNQAEALVVLSQPASTGSATTFQAFPVATSVALPEGEHTLTVCLAGGGLSLDKMVIAAAV